MSKYCKTIRSEYPYCATYTCIAYIQLIECFIQLLYNMQKGTFLLNSMVISNKLMMFQHVAIIQRNSFNINTSIHNMIAHALTYIKSYCILG